MLSERAATVLNVLVGEYLRSATQVASDDIARSLGKKISSATVRNTMAQLTENGYISRPHVSSGGVPSDRGYRYYVESLPETPQLSSELRESVDRDLAETEPDIGTWSKRSAAILPGLNRSQMQSNQLELNSLEEQVKEGSVSLMREAESANDHEHYTDGLRLLLSQPEFSKGELARQLVQLVEERVLRERVLDGVPETENPAVFIGSENRDEFLNPFGVILCQYRSPKGVNGTICVVGPKRMGYVAVIGGVRHLSAFMSQMTQGIQGDLVE